MTCRASVWVGSSSWENAWSSARVCSAGPSFCSVHGRETPSMVKQAWASVGMALPWQIAANRT